MSSFSILNNYYDRVVHEMYCGDIIILYLGREWSQVVAMI